MFFTIARRVQKQPKGFFQKRSCPFSNIGVISTFPTMGIIALLRYSFLQRNHITNILTILKPRQCFYMRVLVAFQGIWPFSKRQACSNLTIFAFFCAKQTVILCAKVEICCFAWHRRCCYYLVVIATWTVLFPITLFHVVLTHSCRQSDFKFFWKLRKSVFARRTSGICDIHV